MPRRIDARISPGNLPAGIDKEGMPRRKLYHSKIRQRTVGSAHLAVTVGQQLEVQSFFGAELLMRVNAVDAHAQHHRMALGVLRLIHLEVVGFAGTARSLV